MKIKKDDLKIIGILVGIGVIIFVLRGQTQGVVGVDCLAFKTNSDTYGTYDNSNVWVVADCDNNGDYEAYGFHSVLASVLKSNVRGQTPEGYDWGCWTGTAGSDPQIRVFYGTSSAYVLKRDYGSASSADTSCEIQQTFSATIYNEDDGLMNSINNPDGFIQGDVWSTDYDATSGSTLSHCDFNPNYFDDVLVTSSYISVDTRSPIIESGSTNIICHFNYGGSDNLVTYYVYYIGGTTIGDCHICASSDDNIVSRSELGTIISKWISG